MSLIGVAMKFAIFSLMISFSTLSLAEVSRNNVSEMIDQMVAKDVISKEEAAKAKAKLGALNADQWKQINDQAKVIAARTPASLNPSSANRIEEVQGLDLDGAQFKQIQKDIGKIVPKMHD